MANIQHPTFGVHVNRGEDAPDSFYLGDDENVWDWIHYPAEQGVGWDSLEDEPIRALIQMSLPDGYYYWQGHFFDASKGLPLGLTDLSDARRTVTITAAALFDDKAYIATMGLEEVTPEEFYDANLPSSRILVAKG